MQDFLTRRGLTASTVTVPQMIESMLEFYRSVRASGLANDTQSDMLLYQWGVFDWGHGPQFEIEMTRQCILAGAGGDDAISQLRFTAYFSPTNELQAIGHSNRWCKSVAELASFSSFIHKHKAYEAVQSVRPSKVTLQWTKM